MTQWLVNVVEVLTRLLPVKQLASAVYPLNTRVLGEMNNRLKVIKRMAYGYRDSAYFFLTIKADFPGKAQ